jgi:DMSO/TMAO reductase YedYZ molybdopterin-dependent catalytic subunit
MHTRRNWLAATARLGAAGFAARWLNTAGLLAQAPGRAPGTDALIARAVRPPDYETPVALLDSFITPNERFFVRSHLPAPTALDAAQWTLTLDGSVTTPLSLSLAELRRMPASTVTVTLECAGNGRAFHEPAVAGIQWEKGAVGTARWTGVRVADLLARAGVKPSARFLVTKSADRPLATMPAFVRQVTMAKALNPDTLVAYEMNGVPIPPLHGFPLRLIVPGWEGAYAVKWLTSLTASDTETDSFWVASAYRYPTRAVAPGEAVDARDMGPLTGLVVKSLITTPANRAVVPVGRPLTVAGFAWAGEADIARVEISIDNGVTWQAAQLVGERAKYAWRRFEHQVTLAGDGAHEILSRATDSNGNTQPKVAAWNPSGYLWNQWDSVTVRTGTVSTSAPATPPSPATAGGPGPEVFSRACNSCHGTDLVDQQRLTRGGWQREVEKMMRWGAPVPDADKDPLIDYLVSRVPLVR